MSNGLSKCHFIGASLQFVTLWFTNIFLVKTIFVPIFENVHVTSIPIDVCMVANWVDPNLQCLIRSHYENMPI